ncbi:hypothetical protein CsSME_00026483 [Camellia sinensis var. sinensis]
MPRKILGISCVGILLMRNLLPIVHYDWISGSNAIDDLTWKSMRCSCCCMQYLLMVKACHFPTYIPAKQSNNTIFQWQSRGQP